MPKTAALFRIHTAEDRICPRGQDIEMKIKMKMKMKPEMGYRI